MNPKTTTFAEFLAQESLSFPAVLQASRGVTESRQAPLPIPKPKKRPSSQQQKASNDLSSSITRRAAQTDSPTANEPGWQSAMAAIAALTKSDVFELRALTNPPIAVQVGKFCVI